MPQTHYTNAELTAKLEALLPPGKRIDPWSNQRWRVKYSNYGVVALGGIAYLTKDFAKRARWTSNCVWWADAMAGSLLGWASQQSLPPIVFGSVSALYVGWHEPPEGKPGQGHRLNFTLDAAGKLHWIDASYAANPDSSRWIYPMSDHDEGFFDLYI